MEWFTGDVSAAVAQCMTNKAFLVVFIKDSSQDSVEVESTLNSFEISTILNSNSYVCLNLEKDGVSGKQFAAIYPVMAVPSIYFITHNGVPLEIIPGECSVENVKQRIASLPKNQQPSAAPTRAPTIPAPAARDNESSALYSDDEAEAGATASSQPQTSGYADRSVVPGPTDRSEVASAPGVAEGDDESQENDGLSKEERVKLAQEKIRQKQMEKMEAEKQKAKEEEIKRRQLGKDVEKLKQFKAEQESKRISDEMKRDKEEARLAKEKVKEQIAQDREARAEKFNKEKAEREELVRRKQQEKLKQQAEEAERQAAIASSRARVQFRLPDGSSVNSVFDADELLQQAREFVTERATAAAGPQFRLATIYPRRVFTDEDYHKTFKDLTLCPTAALLVLPPASSSGSPGPSTSPAISSTGSLIAMIFSPFIAIFSMIYSFIFSNSLQPNQQQQQQQQQQQTQQQQPDNTQPTTRDQRPAEGARRRIGRLSDMPPDDDRNTWNGNSTQQQ